MIPILGTTAVNFLTVYKIDTLDTVAMYLLNERIILVFLVGYKMQVFYL